jgi:hypothetical protein
LNEPRRGGLKPTLRQMMIFVLWAALLAAAMRAMIRFGILGDRPEIVFTMVPIMFGFYPAPVLVILLWILDRAGHVRDWYCSLCMFAGGFLAAALFLLQDPACYVWSGKPTLTFPLCPFLGLVCLFGAWKQWQVVRPGACANCGRRSVIAIAHPLRPGSRRRVNLGTHGWCASCGCEFERSAAGAWVGAPKGDIAKS